MESVCLRGPCPALSASSHRRGCFYFFSLEGSSEVGAVTRDRAGPCKAPEHREASPHAAVNRRLGFCAPVHGDSRARPAGTAGRCPCPGPAPRPPSASPARWNGCGENTQGSAPITRLGSTPDPTGFPPGERRGSPAPRSTPVNGEGPLCPPLNPGERRGSPVPPPAQPALTVLGPPSRPVPPAGPSDRHACP